MSEEKLTSEEASALEAMEQDTSTEEASTETPENTAEEATEQPSEGVKAESEGEAPKEPEFKSTRTEEKPPEGYVPHQAMHAERVKRQELEKQVAELSEWKAKQEAGREEPEPQWVDPLEDPEGHRKWTEWTNAKSAEKLEALEQRISQEREGQERLAQARKYEAEFTEKAPDYPNALQFLVDHRANELRGLGYGENETLTILEKEASGIFQAATNIGMNPAEMAYMRAQSLGYKKVEVKAEPTDTDKVTALAETQKNVEGIGTTGAPQEGQLTVAAMSEMSEAELAKIPEEQFRAIMGG